MAKYQLAILFLLSCVWLAQSRFRILYNFEADNGICTGGCELRERSGASNGLATLMHEGDQLFIQLKTESNCSVSVENVRYSTDGQNMTQSMSLLLISISVPLTPHHRKEMAFCGSFSKIRDMLDQLFLFLQDSTNSYSPLLWTILELK